MDQSHSVSDSHFQYAQSPYTIRTGLANAHREYWQTLAKPGSWFTGAERIAIATEVRNALRCPFCEVRKNALSPYNQEGEHLKGDILKDEVIDAVHRVITDQSRISKTYIENNAKLGFSEEQYVELVALSVTVFSIDEFHRALGLPLEPLPEALAGQPDHYRPSLTENNTGYVSMVRANGARGNEADLWENGKTANVLRALSLVPDGLRAWMKVADEQYLSNKGMMNFSGPNGRAINRMQIELVAGRVSSINECFY